MSREDYGLGQGEVENDSEDACQLVCTGSENAAWNTVQSRGLAIVDQIKSLTHVASESEITQSSGTVGALMHCVVFVKACIDVINQSWLS
jgi:hypothetical protein